MTPEELNRAMQFIVDSQARLSAAQEQDRQDRLEFQTWSRGLNAQVVQLLDHQSQRMDRQDRFYRDSLQQTGEFQNQTLQLQHQTLERQNETLELQRETLQLQRESLHLLHLILDRLPAGL